VSTIDKAAIIEQAAQALSPAIYGMEYDRLPSLLHPAIGRYAAAALPVIAKALLAPLRELIGESDGIFDGDDWADFTIRAWKVRDLLDALEAEVS
jgi:hypothetical protein